jgi:hypothetical protein
MSPPPRSNSPGSPSYSRSKSGAPANGHPLGGVPAARHCPGSSKGPRGTSSPEFELSGSSRSRDMSDFVPEIVTSSAGAILERARRFSANISAKTRPKFINFFTILFSSTRRFQRAQPRPDPSSFRLDKCVFSSTSLAPGGPRGRGWSQSKGLVPL